MSDVMRTELYMEVRTDFRSRFNAMDKTFRIDQDKIVGLPSSIYRYILHSYDVVAAHVSGAVYLDQGNI